MGYETMRWQPDRLEIIDQTLLPGEVKYLHLDGVESVFEAIQKLRVRGAPAIGCCAAFGVLVGIKEQRPASVAALCAAGRKTSSRLATSRPTAVNLFWALRRMEEAIEEAGAMGSLEEAFAVLEREAIAIHDSERELCRLIGEHGKQLLSPGAGVMTHCNAGALATSGYGTALSPMFAAQHEIPDLRVFACETRPLLQGARLTTWELMQASIDVTLICDSMAAHTMSKALIDLVIVGADRIAANGDTANKIGTYSLALLAKAHDIPFYVAAPLSTFDLDTLDGAAIPIEERASEEVTEGFGKRTAPEGVKVYSPAFDVTPAELIAGFITEHGILGAPYIASIARAKGRLQATP